MGGSTILCNKKDKVGGAFYIRTDRVSENKYEVTRITGKHTNAIISCLNWMTENVPAFINERRKIMNEFEKVVFFQALLHLADSPENQIEMLTVSNAAKLKLTLSEYKKSNVYTIRNLTDLILIAVNKNQKYVKVSANNSRQIPNS